MFMKRLVLVVSLLFPVGQALYGPAVANSYGTAQPLLKNIRFWGLTIALWFLSLCGVFGQLAFTSQTGAGALQTENFSGFTGGGFASSPAAGQLDSDNWIGQGINGNSMAYGGSRVANGWARGASAGGVTGNGTGGFWGFDISNGGTVDRALGFQPTNSDFVPGYVEWRIQNNTGSTITEIDIAYDIYVSNDRPRSSSFNFSFFDDDGETLVSSLDFSSPQASTGANWAQTARSATLNVNVADGNFVYFRWTTNDAGGSGQRDELALDNVSAQVVPEPSTYALIFGGIALGVVLFKQRAKSKEQRAGRLREREIRRQGDRVTR